MTRKRRNAACPGVATPMGKIMGALQLTLDLESDLKGRGKTHPSRMRLDDGSMAFKSAEAVLGMEPMQIHHWVARLAGVAVAMRVGVMNTGAWAALKDLGFRSADRTRRSIQLADMRRGRKSPAARGPGWRATRDPRKGLRSRIGNGNWFLWHLGKQLGLPWSAMLWDFDWKNPPGVECEWDKIGEMDMRPLRNNPGWGRPEVSAVFRAGDGVYTIFKTGGSIWKMRVVRSEGDGER